MARKKINAVVTCWHAATGAVGPVGNVGDVSSLRVELPGLDGLRSIDIDVDAKAGKVKVTVQTADKGDSTLTVWPVTGCTAERDDPLMGAAHVARELGMDPARWRDLVDSGQAPPADDPDDDPNDRERPLTMRRPRWRASTIERYRDGHLGDFIAAAEGQEQ